MSIRHNIAILKAEESEQITTHFFGGQTRAADHFLIGLRQPRKLPVFRTGANPEMINAESSNSRTDYFVQAGMFIHRAQSKRAFFLWFLLGLSLLALAACVPIPAEDPFLVVMQEIVAAEEEDPYPPGIVPLEGGGADIDTQGSDGDDAAESDVIEAATLTVKRPNVNIRSGPSIDFQIVAKAVEGNTFTTTGKSEEGWWRICCVDGDGDGDGEDERIQAAWISQIVVTPDERAEALPTLFPLFPEDLAASWNVQYECGSRRCAVNECAAVSRTEINNRRDLRWLEINRIVTWEEACGEDSTWPHQIDRIEGTERYPNSTGLFFFNYWLGPSPGDANALFHLDTGEEIEVWCSNEQEAEVAEESGWTTVYNGSTCHDVRTGMLVSMQYTKRWFFTGEFEGDRYDRAYFGDFEVYRVKLDQTNALLSIVNARAAE